MRLSWKCRTANTDHCCRYSDRTCDRVAFSMKIAHSRHVLHRVIKRPAVAGPELAWCVVCYYAPTSCGPGS
jgi:hypothetical protein